jgi:hypothetical protein
VSRSSVKSCLVWLVPERTSCCFLTYNENYSIAYLEGLLTSSESSYRSRVWHVPGTQSALLRAPHSCSNNSTCRGHCNDSTIWKPAGPVVCILFPAFPSCASGVHFPKLDHVIHLLQDHVIIAPFSPGLNPAPVRGCRTCPTLPSFVASSLSTALLAAQPPPYFLSMVLPQVHGPEIPKEMLLEDVPLKCHPSHRPPDHSS